MRIGFSTKLLDHGIVKIPDDIVDELGLKEGEEVHVVLKVRISNEDFEETPRFWISKAMYLVENGYYSDALDALEEALVLVRGCNRGKGNTV